MREVVDQEKRGERASGLCSSGHGCGIHRGARCVHAHGGVGELRLKQTMMEGVTLHAVRAASSLGAPGGRQGGMHLRAYA